MCGFGLKFFLFLGGVYTAQNYNVPNVKDDIVFSYHFIKGLWSSCDCKARRKEEESCRKFVEEGYRKYIEEESYRKQIEENYRKHVEESYKKIMKKKKKSMDE
ncbi:hypothetical protein Scep_026909 [Stephania cephalantha]|uniref:Uncharacterized protein n=1 Tax=Stephania cephalantha TaxID=152367 RepID=A0AAP0EL14_9MAGN